MSGDPTLLLAARGSVAVLSGPPIAILGRTAGTGSVLATYQGFQAALTATVRSVMGPLLVNLRIQLATPIPLGTTTGYRVSALFSDGSSRDVTLDPSVSVTVVGNAAALGAPGEIRAVAVGSSVLIARFGMVQIALPFSVVPAPDPFVRLELVPTALTLPVGQTGSFQVFALRQSGARVDVTADPNLRRAITGPVSVTLRTGASSSSGPNRGWPRSRSSSEGSPRPSR